MPHRYTRLYTLLLACSLSACGNKGAGGLGIGFSPPPSKEALSRSLPLGLSLGRLYLPQAMSDAYVEVINTSNEAIVADDHALQLQSHAGRIEMPVAGDWHPGESKRVQAQALVPLRLHAQAGELVLLREGSAIEAYATWGAHPEDWPTGYGLLASRLGVSTRAAYPLPLKLQKEMAVHLSASGINEPRCALATGESAQDTIDCAADDSFVAPALHVQIEQDGETLHVAARALDTSNDIDLFGLRLCVKGAGCQTLMQDEPLHAAEALTRPSAMHLSLTQPSVAFGARAQTLYVGDDDWVEIVAPGDTAHERGARLLGIKEDPLQQSSAALQSDVDQSE